MSSHTKPAISDYWVFVADQNSTYWGRPGENMSLGYDIFRELSGGEPLWVAQATTLEEAREKLNTLVRTLPASYFIRDAATAKIVDRSDVDESEHEEHES